LKIVYTLSSGIAEVGRTRQGRATQGNALRNLIKSTTSKMKLIAGNKARNGKTYREQIDADKIIKKHLED
jgi:hypothetical protein